MSKRPKPSVPSHAGQQRLAPIFPRESELITPSLAVVERDGQVVYFTGSLPVFQHPVTDEASFRMFSAQLCVQGSCRESDILRVFGIAKRSLIRWVQQFRDEGPASFFHGRKPTPRVCRVWTTECVAQAQRLLDDGCSRAEVASRLKLKPDTVRKAVLHGRLKMPEQGRSEPSARAAVGSSKGERSAGDAVTPMGRACHDQTGRALAAAGVLSEGAPRQFSAALDVPNAGVLCALPGLVENGLVSGVESGCFKVKTGYYPALTYFLLMANLLLVRARSLERMRYGEPGEWGLLLGHDRCPEVKTMRAKLDELAQPDQVETWSSALAQQWMDTHRDLAGVLYIDGHVRLYHGSQTKLPPRFVSRQRLCLRSVMDYWVNDQEGRPFFVLTAVDTQGLLTHLDTDLIPRLMRDVPHQPSEQALADNPDLHRFSIIVDREGFSPAAMVKHYRQSRVAITTYRRHPYDPWPESDFTEQEVPLAHGVRERMRLASKPFGDPADRLTEIRRLTDRGTQTAIVTADRVTPIAHIAGRQFSRWCQENYFRYATQEYGIDGLASYMPQAAPARTSIVNPAWRTADAQVRNLRYKLNRLHSQRSANVLPHDPNEKDRIAWQHRQAELTRTINDTSQAWEQAKKQRQSLTKRIPIEQLPEDQRPQLIGQNRKNLIDTIAMIAYRAECAQALILRDHLARPDDAKALAKALYRTSGDLIPDPAAKTLTIRLHRGANDLADRAISALLDVLNASECHYPGTDWIMHYELVPLPDPAGQEV